MSYAPGRCGSASTPLLVVLLQYHNGTSRRFVIDAVGGDPGVVLADGVHRCSRGRPAGTVQQLHDHAGQIEMVHDTDGDPSLAGGFAGLGLVRWWVCRNAEMRRCRPLAGSHCPLTPGP